MIIKSASLEDFFIEKVKYLPQSREDTKAYIASTFVKYKNTNSDLSKQSLTIEFAKAKFTGSFEKFQNLGDWILWIESTYPTALNGATTEYYHSIAQSAYYRCYVLTKKTWIVFEEIADKFPYIINHLHAELQTSLLLSPQLET